jgi:hypothetical protein
VAGDLDFNPVCDIGPNHTRRSEFLDVDFLHAALDRTIPRDEARTSELITLHAVRLCADLDLLPWKTGAQFDGDHLPPFIDGIIDAHGHPIRSAIDDRPAPDFRPARLTTGIFCVWRRADHAVGFRLIAESLASLEVPAEFRKAAKDFLEYGALVGAPAD